jgi:hypothetical protein
MQYPQLTASGVVSAHCEAPAEWGTDWLAYMVDHVVDASDLRGRVDIRVGVVADAAGVMRPRGGSSRNLTRPVPWCRRWHAGTISRRSICSFGARPRGLAS